MEQIVSRAPAFARLVSQQSIIQSFAQAQVMLIDKNNYRLDFQLSSIPANLQDYFFQFEVLNANEVATFNAIATNNEYEVFIKQILSDSIFQAQSSITSTSCSLNDTALQIECGFDTFLANVINFQIICAGSCPSTLTVSVNFQDLFARSLFAEYDFTFNLRLISKTTRAVYAENFSLQFVFQTFDPASPPLENSLTDISLNSLDFRVVFLVLNFTVNNELSAEYGPYIDINFKEISVFCDQTLFEDYNCYFQAGISGLDTIHPVNFERISNSEIRISNFGSVSAGTQISLVVQASLPPTFPTSEIDIRIYQMIRGIPILTCAALNAANTNIAAGYTSTGDTFPATVVNATYYTEQSQLLLDIVVDINPTFNFLSSTTIEFSFYPTTAFSVNTSLTVTKALRAVSGSWSTDTKKTVTQSASLNLINVKNTMGDNTKSTMRVSIMALQVNYDPRNNSKLAPFVRARAVFLGSELASDWQYFNDTTKYLDLDSFSVTSNAENTWSIYFFNLRLTQDFLQSLDGEHRLRIVFNENFLPALGYENGGVLQAKEVLHCNFTDTLPSMSGVEKSCILISPREVVIIGYAGIPTNSLLSWQILIKNPMVAVPSSNDNTTNSAPKIGIKLEGENAGQVYHRCFDSLEIPLTDVIQEVPSPIDFSLFETNFSPTVYSEPTTIVFRLMTSAGSPQPLLDDSSNMLLLTLPVEFVLDSNFSCNWSNLPESPAPAIITSVFKAQGATAHKILPQNMILIKSPLILNNNVEYQIICSGSLFPFISESSPVASAFLTAGSAYAAYSLSQNPSSSSPALIINASLSNYFASSKSELTIQIESKISIQGNLSINITLPQCADYTNAQLQLSSSEFDTAPLITHDSIGRNLTVRSLHSISYNSSLTIVISQLVNPQAGNIDSTIFAELFEVQNEIQITIVTSSVPFQAMIASVPTSPEQASFASNDFYINQSEPISWEYLSFGFNTSNLAIVNGFSINLPDYLSIPRSALPEISCAISFLGTRQKVSSCRAVSESFVRLTTSSSIPKSTYIIIVIAGISINQNASNKTLIVSSAYNDALIDHFSVILDSSASMSNDTIANNSTADSSEVMKAFVLDLKEGKQARSLIQFTSPIDIDPQKHKIIASFDGDILPDQAQTRVWIAKQQQNHTTLTLEDYLYSDLDSFVALNSSVVGSGVEIYGVLSTGETKEKFQQTFNRSQGNNSTILKTGETALFAFYPLNSGGSGAMLSLNFAIYDIESNQTLYASPNSNFTTQSADVPTDGDLNSQISRSNSNIFHQASLSFSLAFAKPTTHNALAIKVPLPDSVVLVDEFFSRDPISASLSASGTNFSSTQSIYDPLDNSIYIILSSQIPQASSLNYELTINNVINPNVSSPSSTLPLSLVDLATSSELIAFSEEPPSPTQTLYKANKFINVHYQNLVVPLEDEVKLVAGTLSQPIQLVLEDDSLFSYEFSIALTVSKYHFITHELEDVTSSFTLSHPIIKVPAGTNSVSFQLGTTKEGFYLIQYTIQAGATPVALYLLPPYTKISVGSSPVSVVIDTFLTFYPGANNLPLSLYLKDGLPLSSLALTVEAQIKLSNATNFTADSDGKVVQKLVPVFTSGDNQAEIQFDFKGLGHNDQVQLILKAPTSEFQLNLPSMIFTPAVFDFTVFPVLSVFQLQSILKTTIIIETQASQLGVIFFVCSRVPAAEVLRFGNSEFDVINQSSRDISQVFSVDYGNGLKQKTVIGKKYVKQIGTPFIFPISDLDVGADYYIYAYLQDVVGRNSTFYSLQASTESKFAIL